MQKEKVQRAIQAIEEVCGKCPICSKDCPIAVSLRAMKGLLYDLEAAEE